MLQVTAVVLLCGGAVAAPAQDVGVAARLVEAQTAYEEATKLKDAGKYADAIAGAERALALREAALGDTDLKVAECLNLTGDLYRRYGDFARAEPLLQRGLSIREAALGKNHPDVAATVNGLADLYRDQRLYSRAEPLYERALAIREAALGKNHPDVAQSLNGLADIYSHQWLYSRAALLYQRALAIREAALGENHPDVAQSISGLARLCAISGYFGQAEPLHQRALAIREAALGKSHPDVAESLSYLAALYHFQGLYDRAEPLYERALAIREAALDKNHPDVAESLYYLAILCDRQGLYNRAEQFHEHALAIREAALGKNHPDVAQSLHGLATLYHNQGLYSRALPLYERALAILEVAPGKNRPNVADWFYAMGLLYLNRGQYNHLSDIPCSPGMYGRWALLFERLIAIQEAAVGKNDPSVAVLLAAFAQIHRNQGSSSRAEPLYERAIAIHEETLGKNHPDSPQAQMALQHMAYCLDGLAALYNDQGLYNRAEPLYRRALAIREAAPGRNYLYLPEVDLLKGLAFLYSNQGSYDRAEPLYERTLAIEEATLGKNHSDLVKPLNDFARFRLAQGRLAAAVPLFARALAISEGRLRREALYFSESRLASFLQFVSKEDQGLYSLARVYPDDADVRGLALTSALLFKGRSIEEAADTSRTILRSMGPRDRDAFERLRVLRTRFAQLSLDGPGPRSPVEYQQGLKRLADEGDILEADLAKRSAPLRALTALPSAADILQRVTAALPRDGALVELVAYADSPPVPKPGTPESKLPTQLRYLALVLFPDGRTGAVDLGPAAAIDKAALHLRDALATRNARFQEAAQELYRLAFKPLLPLLASTRKVFLSPDGQLALVPFAALHDGRRFLADAFDFTYLTSGRDLLPPPGDIPTSTSAVVLADPDYSASPPAQSSPAERSDSLERFFSENRAGVSPQPWVPLPGSRQEAEAIQRLLPQAQVFLGADASKERLLHLSAPGILHIATHGFFLPDAVTPPGARALGASDLQGGGPVPRLPDPLLRSGLVLAGASSPADLGNSLVTALELAGLDLWGTQLVVLSSCDTGRGDVKRGEGVYGLRRAMVVAGAQTLVVSLWKVDDETTRTMMESYYRNLLAGQGRAEALRSAMLSLRAQYPHPHYWAPFIALGRDTPLRGFATSATE